MQMECTEAREHIDAQALGGLDADDVRLLDSHLAGCADCRALVQQADETAVAFALAVPLRMPNASLKARIMASAAVLESGNKLQAHNRAIRGWCANRYMPTAMVAGLALVIGLGSWSIYLQNQTSDLRHDNLRVAAGATTESAKLATANTQLVQMSNFRNETLRDQDAITEIVSAPDVTRTQLVGTREAPGSTGRYVWSKEAAMGALVARDLPALKDDQTYGLWLVYEQGWILAGTFEVDDEGNGNLIVQDLELDVAAAGALQSYAVSAEPSATVREHTGKTILQGSVN